MLDLLTIISANGLSEDLNICRNGEEYRNRGNIFNEEEIVEPSPVEEHVAEPTMIDAAFEKVNGVIAALLASLPDLTSVDLSMEKPSKSKGL